MNFDYVRWLRGTLIVGLFISLIIPFIVANGVSFPNMFFPFITGKNFTFRILVEILFGLYVLLALREPKFRPRFSWILVAAVAFTVWAGVATLFSVDPVKSFWSNFERMEGFVTILHLLAYLVVASAVFAEEKLSTWYFRASLGASAVMGLYGLFQLAGRIQIDQGGVRLDGTLGNAIYLAVYMLFNIFFGFILLHRDWRSVGLRWLYGAIMLFDTFMLFATATRGTELGLLGGLVVAAGYLIWATRQLPHYARLRKISFISIGTIAVLILVFIGVRNAHFIQKIEAFNRLASISAQDRTTQARFQLWGMAWQGFKERPITGWGQENFNYVFNKYYVPSMYDQEQWFDRAHNAYIDWLINAGAPGILLFISLFVTGVWAIVRARDLSVPERAALLGLIAGFAFHELFVFDNIVSYIQFFTLLAFLHARSQREVPGTVWLSRPVGEHGIAIAAPIAGVLVLAAVYFVNVPGIANATGLLQGLMVTSPQALPQNIQAFKSVLDGAALGRQEAAEQITQFAVSAASAQAISPDVKQQLYDAANTAMITMNEQRPHDARLELFYGLFLAQYGQYKDSLTQLQNAQADSPQKQQILYQLGSTYLSEGDLVNALGSFKHAYAEFPANNQAALYYAEGLYYNNQGALADKILQDHFKTVVPDDETLLRALYNTKQYARAEQLINNRLQKNPDDQQNYLQLAAVYYGAGDKQQAIATLRAGAQKIPGFAAQANQLIDQLQKGN